MKKFKQAKFSSTNPGSFRVMMNQTRLRLKPKRSFTPDLAFRWTDRKVKFFPDVGEFNKVSD